MSGTTSTTSFSSDDASLPVAIGGGGSAGPSVGAGNATGTVASVDTTNVDLAGLPAQYSTAGSAESGLGFFSRQLEYVPTAVALGPDGALYTSGLSGLPYPDGFARVMRIEDPNGTTGFDGQIHSGVPETFASGFSQINGLSLDAKGDLYVLEYANAANIYDPTKQPGDLPASELIRVDTDGTRTTISGPELKLGNYVLADKNSGDVYISINNADIHNGEVIRYHFDTASGQTTHDIVASGLENPRGLSFGPDGNLYVLEQGVGTPSDSPDAATAPTIPFIPGVVDERGGFTAAITKIDLIGDGGQERVFTGLPSIREVNAVTGEDRIISIGSNGFAIAPDGTAYVATGGGLSQATADALGPFGDYVKGLVKVEGLFDGNPADAKITPTFDSVAYAAQNGPDGSTTLFNNQSNLNDVTLGADGKIYAVDAARNVMYGFDPAHLDTPDSATVFQKQAPVLTPVQYAAVVAAGGDPAADYHVEASDRIFKAANGAPDTPGRAEAAAHFTAGDVDAAALGAPTDATDTSGVPSADSAAPRGEDASVGTASAGATSGLPGSLPITDPTIPGPIDPLSPPILASNIYTPYFDPFFGGNYTPGTAPALPAGEHGGTYTVSHVYSFGDRLVDDGGTYGADAVAQAAGQPAPNASSLYYQGGFSDGPNWTEDLSRMLGAATDQDTSFGYVLATARDIANPLDPFSGETTLNTFAGQIDAFQQSHASFSSNDLVTVTFGGNDLTLPSNLTPDQGIVQSVQAIVDGMTHLADLGAQHFLVTNLPNIELAPLFHDPNFLAQLGAAPGTFAPLVQQFNTQLESAMQTFEHDKGVDVQVLDLNKLFDAIEANPSAYGFANVDQPVLAAPPLQPGTPTTYNPAIVGQDPAVEHATLFLDPFFHPTALGQAIVAETARSDLLIA